MDEQDGITDSDEMDASSVEEAVAEDISAKEAERRRLQAEIEAYLAKGGQIDRIPANVVADPPKKPESNYGGQPI